MTRVEGDVDSFIKLERTILQKTGHAKLVDYSVALQAAVHRLKLSVPRLIIRPLLQFRLQPIM
jgi:hypothetical protein